MRLIKYLTILTAFNYCVLFSTSTHAQTGATSIQERFQAMIDSTLTFLSTAEIKETPIPQVGQPRLNLTPTQQQWLHDNPRLKVVMVESFLPPAMFDEADVFQGPSAEMLNKISSLTGLEFDVQLVESAHELAKQIDSGRAHIIVALHPSAVRERTLRFTRSYLDTPFVLVSGARANSPNTLEDLTGKRLGVIRGSPLHELIERQYPSISMIMVDNPAQALALVADGDADAAISSLISARHLITHLYPKELRIQSTIGEISARAAFAVALDAITLHAILEKALLSIPPQESQDLSHRWYGSVAVAHSKAFQQHQGVIQMVAGTSLVLLIAGAWIFVIKRKIHSRAISDAALEDQRQLMSVLINGTPNPIYVRDREARLLICNDAYLTMLGTDRQNVIGKTVLESVLPDAAQAQACHAMYLHAMQNCIKIMSDRALSTPDGRELMIFHWVLPYRDSTGTASGLIGGWIDISERHHLLKQLRAAKIEADNANQAKTVFLATISHEIRTPMNAVLGLLELSMKRFDQGTQDRHTLETASKAAQDLLELMSDMLDAARIDSGNLSLSPERTELRELVDATINSFEGLAREKNLGLSREINTGEECDVLIDPLRFKQVLSNVLSNAIKFTTFGGVHLSLSVTPRSDTQHFWIEVIVQDSGIGISVEDQQRIFSPFVQAGNHAQSARSGTGLGLSISHALCAMMGGTLQLQSTLGKGTDVKISLPLLALEPRDSVLHDASFPWRSLNVLVVDDTSTNRMLLSEQLDYLGHRVSTAVDGAQGLNAWRTDCFDVVITDCNMPLMSGYDLARAIRSDEQSTHNTCLILGFTANTGQEEKARCLEAGMNDCLLKPMKLKDLEAGLNAISLIPPPDPAAATTMKLMDLSSLEQLTRGNKTITQQLLQDLAKNNDADQHRLTTLIDAGDLPGLGQVAHRIKGGMRVIQAYAVIAICEELEALCLQNSPKALLHAHVEKLNDAIAQVADQLANL